MSYPYDLDLSFGSEFGTADSFAVVKHDSDSADSEESNNDNSNDNNENNDNNNEENNSNNENNGENNDPFNGGFSDEDVGEGN